MNIAEAQGICIGRKIGVRFDQLHNKVLGVGLNGIEIVRAEAWKSTQDDKDGNSRFEENVDYKETHPQICVVTKTNPDYPYKVGDKLFVHYMAFETAKNGDIVTYDAIIDADYVFFTLKDDEIIISEDIYIGEPIYSKEEKTKSGIVLAGGKEDSLKIRILHTTAPFYKYLPQIGERAKFLTQPIVKPGDIVISQDKYNYHFKYNKKKYVMLKGHEIAAVYEAKEEETDSEFKFYWLANRYYRENKVTGVAEDITYG